MKKFMKENILFILSFFVVSFCYFLIPVIIMPDSVEYYGYLDIYYGIKGLSTWSVVRGFTLPTILFVFTRLFGNNLFGLEICTYFFWCLFIIPGYLFLINATKDVVSKNWKKWIKILYCILILFNPILIGYFHGLLTEFVAIPFAMLGCMISYAFLKHQPTWKKPMTYVYPVIYIFLFIFCWFLKQPYFTIALFPLCIVVVLSIFKYKSWKDFCYRFGIVILSSVALLFSISMWSNFLVKNGVDYKHDRNNEYFLKEAFFNGMSNLRIDRDEDHYNYDFLKENTLLKKKTITKLLKSKKRFKIVNVYNNDGLLVDTMIFKYSGKDYDTKDSLDFYTEALAKHPLYVLESYINGYYATIDIFYSRRDEDNYYWPERTINHENHENYSIGLGYLNNEENFIWINEQYHKQLKKLNTKIKIPTFIKKILYFFADILFALFKFLFILLPFGLLYVLYQYLFKKKRNPFQEISIIFLGFAFFHTLFHVVTGAIIDRYVYLAFPEVVIGFLFLFLPKKTEKEEVVMKKKKTKINNNELIFVIPAYNEEKNIEKVIKDIRKNVVGADIVVTNDFSKDNTKKIVTSLGVPCLNVPFNMGYAMAVQTGIKYAYKNHYKYVVQFDADGQHQASEVNKMIKKMEETNCNIVIGSRFLQKTDYKHPFFRKIGTSLFRSIIKSFCKKNITDPTSGFQLLDESVIERYATIGKYPEFPDANLVIEMLLEGYSIEEVSVIMKENTEGKSMHGGIIKPIKYMITVTYTIFFIIIRGHKIGGKK